MSYTFDSDEERYFSYWLEEIEEDIESWDLHPEPFILFDGLVVDKKIKLKTKVKIKEKRLLHSHIYTADFHIIPKNTHGWLSDVFHFDASKGIYIEIKPKFDMHNMSRLFRLNQKWIYKEYGIFVNMVIVDTLFKQTFVPQKCAFKKNKERNKRFEKCELKK